MTRESIIAYLGHRGFQVTVNEYKSPLTDETELDIRIRKPLIGSVCKRVPEHFFNGTAEGWYKMQTSWLDNLIDIFNKKFDNKEVNNMEFNVDIATTRGSATLYINGHTYPILIRNTRFGSAPYSDVNWCFEADILRYSAYGDYCRKANYIRSGRDCPEIKDVIFNEPATIILWKDGTKTVVKCQDGDEYDPEKGLAMAIVKKLYGNKGNYNNQINKWTDKYWEKQKNARPTAKREFNKLYNKLNWMIKEWYV